MDIDDQAVRQRHESGESVYDISRDLHTNYHRVKEAIERAGGVIVPSGSRRQSEVSPDDIVAGYMRGMSEKELAAEHDVSRATIRYWLKKKGVK